MFAGQKDRRPVEQMPGSMSREAPLRLLSHLLQEIGSLLGPQSRQEMGSVCWVSCCGDPSRLPLCAWGPGPWAQLLPSLRKIALQDMPGSRREGGHQHSLHTAFHLEKHLECADPHCFASFFNIRECNCIYFSRQDCKTSDNLVHYSLCRLGLQPQHF